MTLKLTKNELRLQQLRLQQLQRYLPTLQLKKALLQAEVNDARHAIQKLEGVLQEQLQATERFASLLTIPVAIDYGQLTRPTEVAVHAENIAGVDVPQFDSATFPPLTYDLFETPIWLEAAVERLRELTTTRAHIHVEEQRKLILERELREVSIRVNLFEKVLIPRSERSIKRIRIFLGDQQLATVGQCKVAKAKILARAEEVLVA